MSSPFQFNSDHTKLHICGPRLLPLQSLWECFFFLIYHSCCKEGCSLSHISPAPSTMPYLPDHTFLRMKHPHHINLQQGVWNSSCILISKWWNASSGVTSRQCYNTKTGDCTSWGRELLPAVLLWFMISIFLKTACLGLKYAVWKHVLYVLFYSPFRMLLILSRH